MLVGLLGATSCTASVEPAPPPVPTTPSAPDLRDVDRLCPGPPAPLGRGGDLAELRATARSFEPMGRGFVVRLAEPLPPAVFLERYGPLLELPPTDTLHWWPGEPLRLGQCHDGVRVAGAGLGLFGRELVDGASAVVYQVDASGQPTLSPAAALEAALPALRVERCDTWTLTFQQAHRDPQLVYGCQTGERVWSTFSAHDGRVFEARRGPIQ